MKLKTLQEQVQGVILSDITPSSSLDWVAAEIVPSATMSGAEKLQIYRDMFESRVIDALQDDYPLLHEIIGCSYFEELALDYIQAYPSRSFTLEWLGDHFPEYLQKETLPELPFAADLARLEYAVTQAFHAKETSILQAGSLQMDELDLWMERSLKTVPSLRLLQCHYDVNSLYSSFQQGSLDEEIEVETSEIFLMVWKYQDHIWRLELDEFSYDFLQSISAGTLLGEAIDQILTNGLSPEKIQEIFSSFSMWVNEGVFQEP